MAAINFPASPTLNQIFTPPGGPTYTWNGTAWVASGSGGGGGASLSVGAAPPASPTDGALWWESDSGILFVYYNDGNTSQWVQASPSMDPGSFYTKTQIDALLAARTNGSAFLAYPSAAQSIANNTTTNYTKLANNTEVYDADGSYDPVLYRFTPKVPGLYLINGCVSIPGGTYTAAYIFKNGGGVHQGVLGQPVNSPYVCTVTAMLQMNGTTDYVELFGTQSSGAALNAGTGTGGSYFQAAMIRGA